jgi:hypothetical protein
MEEQKRTVTNLSVSFSMFFCPLGTFRKELGFCKYRLSCSPLRVVVREK